MMKTALSALFIVGSMAAPVASIAGEPRDLPIYEMSRTATPIKVDGRLDDAVWTSAPRFGDFRLVKN